MWALWKRLYGSAPVRHTGVPAVVADRAGAEVRFSDREPWRIEWAALAEVGVNVVVSPEGDYSEGFWALKGPTPADGFEVPVELVAGSDAFNAQLFDLPGFDPTAYVRARKAEARGEPGYFVCWRRASAEPGAAADPRRHGLIARGVVS
jgi:hypothetical protein